MAMGIRKRKRREEIGDSEENEGSVDGEAIQAALKKHFEAQFRPLEERPKLVVRPETHLSEIEGSEGSDWEGFASDDGIQAVQVVDYAGSIGRSDNELSKGELKAFMSSRPPTSTAKTERKSTTDATSDDEAEALNLKNDVALQRLLKESHLLDSSSILSASGNNRHKATDLRLQSLGADSSALAQDKMPMAHRKGILAKAAQREGKRRREAQENGIILEKVTKSKKSSIGEGKKRERGVDAPSVGSFRGGMLKLSKRDIASIQGPKRGSSARRGLPKSKKPKAKR
ncbi:MAG: hypothetical protein M1820_000166 [Bogoriella megaspora]|nr:MAG: hypothetical protein M1820_000166 [Bogoriella megaspora]